MSLFTSLVLPMLEREIKSAEPEIAQLMAKQLHNAAKDVIAMLEDKFKVDIDGDGKIGATK